jgi:glycosyltransferase involved in cell wall biosynthesis
MKIGLIGNMNNNNFAMMRYFRDQGVDAHLLLDATDGKWCLSHFKPEADTWNIEKWAPFIHQTDIPNAPVAALDFPWSWILSYRSLFRAKIGLQDAWIHHVSKEQIKMAYANYDILIGSGITPATLNRAGIVLDIFYPYSTGVEYLKTPSFTSQYEKRRGIYRLIANKIITQQAKGIRAAKKVLNSDFGLTQEVLLSLGKNPNLLAVPMLYVEKETLRTPLSEDLKDVNDLIRNSDFTILHHSRLMWKKPAGFSSEVWLKQSKNNDWLFRAFSKLKKERPNLRACIIVVEYGPDVEATKQLARDLGISDYIDWRPIMNRREILRIISQVSVGAGEFYSVPRMIWGGTGWEVLASGKPLLQGANFEENEFDRIYGYPLPPMLPVRKEEDILMHLLDMVDNPEKRLTIGHGAKEWFNQYNGVSLAKKWLDLIFSPCDPNTNEVSSIQGVNV